jgi:hypothetical protein
MLVGNKIPGQLAECKFHVNDFRETIRMNEKSRSVDPMRKQRELLVYMCRLQLHDGAKIIKGCHKKKSTFRYKRKVLF